MKKNIFLTATLRKPISLILLVSLFCLISFVIFSKAIGFILVQRETETLGSYYRSIGVLENFKDPQSGDVSAGADLIKNSPHFSYGNSSEVVSGVMSETINDNRIDTLNTWYTENIPPEYWPNTHTNDIWFTGDLVAKEEIGVNGEQPVTSKVTGWTLKFKIDTILAAYPEDASQGNPIVLLFLFENNESAIPAIEEMKVGKRYLIRAWDDSSLLPFELGRFRFLILPLNDQQLWYLPLEKDEVLDFSSSEMASIKNNIDILNENIHAIGIIATTDMSAMPMMQEASRFFYITAGRWLNHQDDLAGSKLIVIPEYLASKRGLGLGDKLQLTFRPLRDTYYGRIRDGVDTALWRSYPTYQDTFTIMGIYTSRYGAAMSYIPLGSLRPGFASTTQKQFRNEAVYIFVLDSSRSQTLFVEEYQDALQSLGISLTFLDNNGAAYWAAVDPIRRSTSVDALIFSLLMVAVLIMAVFLYLMQFKREYAIARALGVPRKEANIQTILPLLLVSLIGILLGGLTSWKHALDKAKDNLSSIPTPAGVTPSAELNTLVLVVLCLAIFLLLMVFAWLGVQLLSRKSVLDLLRGQSQRHVEQKQTEAGSINSVNPSSSLHQTSAVIDTSKTIAATRVAHASMFKYKLLTFCRFIFRQGVRSGFKSILTLAIALVFMFASVWLSQTMQRSQKEIDRLYDTTLVEADILPLVTSSSQSLSNNSRGNGFVYLNTVNSILDSGYMTSRILKAESVWEKIQGMNSQPGLAYFVWVYTYDSPEELVSGLENPDSLNFASGWDSSLFTRQWTIEDLRKEGIPMIFPSRLLEQSGFEVGEQVKVTEMSSSVSPGVIVGQYSGMLAITINNIKMYDLSGSQPILIPLSALEALEGSRTAFSVARFVLDPAKNRELSRISLEMEKLLKVPGAGTIDLRFVFWDEELRIVVDQLEKNLSILKVLYPIVLLVSVLIAAGLCFLLLLQKARVAAILRVLGTTRTVVRLVLVAEPMCLSILGVFIGLGLTAVLWTSSAKIPVGTLLTIAGLYLAGALVGLVCGAILVTNK
ncbi:MAG: hypothetical protein CVU43_08575, partial [Chloroflexi bacterium HGW-Chloroflexi-5]